MNRIFVFIVASWIIKPVSIFCAAAAGAPRPLVEFSDAPLTSEDPFERRLVLLAKFLEGDEGRCVALLKPTPEAPLVMSTTNFLYSTYVKSPDSTDIKSPGSEQEKGVPTLYLRWLLMKEMLDMHYRYKESGDHSIPSS